VIFQAADELSSEVEEESNMASRVSEDSEDIGYLYAMEYNKFMDAALNGKDSVVASIISEEFVDVNFTIASCARIEEKLL
jgi:hypothetical protein